MIGKMPVQREETAEEEERICIVFNHEQKNMLEQKVDEEIKSCVPL